MTIVIYDNNIFIVEDTGWRNFLTTPAIVFEPVFVSDFFAAKTFKH